MGGVSGSMRSTSGDPRLLIGFLAYIALVMSCGWYMSRAQTAYFHRYRRMRHAQLPLPADLGMLWMIRDPLLPWRLFRLMWERQGNADLERLRQRAVRRWWTTALAMLIGLAIVPLIQSL